MLLPASGLWFGGGCSAPLYSETPRHGPTGAEFSIRFRNYREAFRKPLCIIRLYQKVFGEQRHPARQVRQDRLRSSGRSIGWLMPHESALGGGCGGSPFQSFRRRVSHLFVHRPPALTLVLTFRLAAFGFGVLSVLAVVFGLSTIESPG